MFAVALELLQRDRRGSFVDVPKSAKLGLDAVDVDVAGLFGSVRAVFNDGFQGELKRV